MERFLVSRDDAVYESWPDLVLTAGGKLICIFTESVHHRDRSRTRLVLRESLDRGRTWSAKIPFTPETNGMPFWDCARIVRLPDDRLAVTCNLMSIHGETAGDIRLWLGDPEGTKWEGPLETPGRGIVPDKLVVLSSGRWLLSAHQPHPAHGFLFQQLWYSDDEGRTWSDPVTVADKAGLQLCEASILQLSDGSLVAFLRENSGEGMDGWKVMSKDEGRTWSEPVRVPLPGCHRPTVGRLASGSILVTYRFSQGGKGWLGNWTQNLFAALTDEASCLADKRNEQWTRILPIDYDRSPESDLGYSGWVQFPDGEIYIVQYIVDDAPKGHIRGYSLHESEFGLPTAEAGTVVATPVAEAGAPAHDTDGHAPFRSQALSRDEAGYRELRNRLFGLIDGEPDGLANLANASALLYDSLPDLNWAGFYLYRNGVLVLGPFQGKPACIRIPLGKGVCGTAAEQRKTLVVRDVHAFPGHIACDGASASEIVVPLMQHGRLMGVLDIDSPLVGRFDEIDRAGLEEYARLLCEQVVFPVG